MTASLRKAAVLIFAARLFPRHHSKYFEMCAPATWHASSMIAELLPGSRVVAWCEAEPTQITLVRFRRASDSIAFPSLLAVIYGVSRKAIAKAAKRRRIPFYRRLERANVRAHEDAHPYSRVDS